MEQYESRLRGAVGIVEREGLQVLRDRMPRNGYSGKHKQGRGIPASGHSSSHTPSHAIAPKRDQQSSVRIHQASARAGRYDLIPAAQ